MPDLTVIDGDKGTEKQHAIVAAGLFYEFSRQMLRLLAGADNVVETGDAMVRFIDYIDEHQVRYLMAMESATFEVRNRLVERLDKADVHIHDSAVFEAALKVAAECLADDTLSGARLSARRDDFQGRVEWQMLDREERSRQHGWSYLTKLAERLGKWKAPKKR